VTPPVNRRPALANRLLFVSTVGLAVAVAAGMTASVRADSVVMMGYISGGTLGDGSTPDSIAPVIVPELTSNVTALSARNAGNLVIQDGGVKMRGLGASTASSFSHTAFSNAHLDVPGLSSGVTAIDAGLHHRLAVQNGAAFAWGVGTHGALGNGSTANTNAVVQVTGLTSGVTAVSAGERHSLAIQNGAVKAWGGIHAIDLLLGTSQVSSSTTPIQVPGLSSNVTAVDAGPYRSFAIQNGGLKGWGENSFGELGDGGNAPSGSVVSVQGLTSGVTAVAAGYYHTLAIKDGDVFAWGNDGGGALGNGPGNDGLLPMKVLDLDVDIVQIDAGLNSSYALAADGKLFGWGDSLTGDPAVGMTELRQLPTLIPAPSGYKYTSFSSADAYLIATVEAIPEPTSLALIGLGCLAMRRQRR
jgi:trimeric autotransporter adhesin